MSFSLIANVSSGAYIRTWSATRMPLSERVSGHLRDAMQIGVYGSGYLGTLVSACLADFGTPVICCHPDSSRMVAMAQGNVPFFEKNLNEVIKRNVRAGRLAYSTDMEAFARRAHAIFLAEDSAQHLGDLAVRIARLAPRPPILSLVTPVPVGTASGVEKRLKQE